jgi:predicted NUDIX family phosphoesterase
MGNLDEKVLCFNAQRLIDLGYFSGYSTNLSIIHKLFNSKLTRFEFLPRHQVEEDPTYKQVIPYSVIKYYGPDKDKLIFSYTRGKSGGEDRLKRKKSIGIGGHISDSVTSNRSKICEQYNYRESIELSYAKIEAMREINEEVQYDSSNPLLFLCGLINDDSDPVGAVHFGLIYNLIVTNPNVRPNEDSISNGEMITIQEAKKNIDEYENWSRLIIREMKI